MRVDAAENSCCKCVQVFVRILYDDKFKPQLLALFIILFCLLGFSPVYSRHMSRYQPFAGACVDSHGQQECNTLQARGGSIR